MISEEVQMFFKGLANEKRQAIMLLFLDQNEVTVNQVSELIGIGQSTASEQLSMLKRAGLLNSKREGKEVIYSTNKNNILRILQEINLILMKCCN
ncbi:helix-turn-helix transcriptional regulator [Sporosarcina sp. D27]|uniref:ArsR/SmtB family transcription factor n=1 Tax=Sporosarcina sp. D27 TaxID=1382305 RepID=UPI00047082CA|nr:metalloregulator ArsR/SmtB family transcription factor [Sporosarcina sp. D27]